MSAIANRLLLAAAPWPLIPSLSPRFARLYRRPAAVRAAYLLLYLVALVAIGLVAPWLLVPWVAAAGLASVVILWRTRPGSGRSQRLPPGPLPLLPVRAVTEHQFIAKHIARYGSVSKAALPTAAQPVVLVSGLQRGAAVLRANDERLKWVGMSFDAHIPAGFLRSMTPSDHHRYSRLLRAAFASSVVEACEADLAQAARAVLARMTAGADGAAVDPLPSLSRYAVASFARLFFGVTTAGDLERIEKVYTRPGALDGLWRGTDPELREAVADVSDILERRAAEIAETIAAGGEPVASFLTEVVRDQPASVADPTLTLNLVFLFATAAHDVTGLLHWVVKMLGDNPVWNERCRADSPAGDLSSRIVLETLRLEQSEFISRKVLETFEIDGFVVPAEWYLRICVQESHRDPAIFPNPDVFDPDRFLGAHYGRDEYSPFGMALHSCLGVKATVTVASTFVQELARGYDWSLLRDGTPEFTGYHWRPHRRLRIGIEARTSTAPIVAR
jgi:enediyne biosynthesis protein E7